MRQQINICLACGYEGLDVPQYENGVPSFEICKCCLFQSGFDDTISASGQSLTPLQWRAEWITNGMPWRSRSFDPPSDWDPRKQLQNAVS
jgi:hypothetical protein